MDVRLEGLKALHFWTYEGINQIHNRKLTPNMVGCTDTHPRGPRNGRPTARAGPGR